LRLVVHERANLSKQTHQQQHHNLVLVRLIVVLVVGVVVVVGVGVGCRPVFMSLLSGLLGLGVCRCVKYSMSFLSCFVRVLVVGVVMGWVGLRSLSVY
jgi:NAD/NADP transhydrogenase beta subunit